MLQENIQADLYLDFNILLSYQDNEQYKIF